MKGRIAFLSPRHFGQLGTPGTYRVIEEVAHYHEVRIFAQAPSDNSVYWRQEVPLIPLVGALSERAITPVLPALRDFRPDVIYIFNAPRWPETIERLKKEFPFCKFIFDIKTPLLVDDENQKALIRKLGDGVLELVDCVVTHAKESVDTWFSRCHHEPVLLPPGIDISNFSEPLSGPDIVVETERRPLQWVYAASLHKMRQSSSLIQGFKIFLARNPNAAVLHIYGDGADRAALEKQVVEIGLSGNVLFHGLVPQKELFRSMAKMNGAIGWVPTQLYDKSPSLKVLEYAAAGLPILATATTAHREMESDGFTLDYCDDTPESLAEGLSKWLVNGFSDERVRQNRRAAEGRDYSRLVRGRLLPVLDEMVEGLVKNGVSRPRTKTRSASTHELEKEVAVNPLRVLIVQGSLCPSHSGFAQVVRLAELMAMSGQRVYLAYQNLTFSEFELDERVVLVPYEDEGALETLLRGGRLDVAVVFSFDLQGLFPVARSACRHGVPMIMHEPSCRKNMSKENPGECQKGAARRSWETEVVFSMIAEQTNLTTDVDSGCGIKDWNAFLNQSIVNAERESGSDSLEGEELVNKERALHLRRIRKFLKN